MSSTQAVRKILSSGHVLSINELGKLELPKSTLFRTLQTLIKQGEVQRVQRGHYQLTSHFDAADSWVMATRAAPQGVLCLLSALAFHQLGTQLPADVWLALPKSAYRPVVDYPPVQFVHFSGSAFTQGIEEHILEGGKVRVYSVTKTVADCFKFRNRLGLDVVLEALKEALQQRRTSIPELMDMARVCRVQAVMAPYVDSFVSG